MSKLFVKKLSEHAILPTRGSEESAGLDLYAADSCKIPSGHRKLINTDICLGIPEGYYGRIAPRSGLAVNSGVDVLAGVVDADYVGPIKVLLANFDSHKSVKVRKGDRVAQIIFEKITIPEIIEIDELTYTGRGDSGFGSTGK